MSLYGFCSIRKGRCESRVNRYTTLDYVLWNGWSCCECGSSWPHFVLPSTMLECRLKGLLKWQPYSLGLPSLQTMSQINFYLWITKSMAFKYNKEKWTKIVNSPWLHTLLEGEPHFGEVWTTSYKQIISLSPYNYPFNPPGVGIVLSYTYVFHSVFVHYIWYFRSQRTVT